MAKAVKFGGKKPAKAKKKSGTSQSRSRNASNARKYMGGGGGYKPSNDPIPW